MGKIRFDLFVIVLLTTVLSLIIAATCYGTPNQTIEPVYQLVSIVKGEMRTADYNDPPFKMNSST